MKKIAVFCGASNGTKPEYVEKAWRLGEEMASSNIGLVYGGASIGVMGAIADGCLGKGGKVWGVIPESLQKMEVGHQHLTELIVVDTMHERKKIMYDLSDAFFILPGGMGTLDEMCEILTWAQLGFHHKPVYLINDGQFFDHLQAHMEYASKEGFISETHLKLYRLMEDAKSALDHFVKISNP
jgi:uncharacterized protein (TIGR00730 family)